MAEVAALPAGSLSLPAMVMESVHPNPKARVELICVGHKRGPLRGAPRLSPFRWSPWMHRKQLHPAGRDQPSENAATCAAGAADCDAQTVEPVCQGWAKFPGRSKRAPG